MSADGAHLRIESLGLGLGRFALDGIDVACRRGEYHILLGPTGSGKSTLLKCILGIHRVEQGRILLDERDITHQLPERRQIGYLPQNYALFPHMSAAGNILFGIAARRPPRAEARTRLAELSAMLGIEHLLDRRVQNLSGGERQKVALARALGTQPRTILLDEPFSSIDEGGRRQLWFELKQLITEIGVTALHITHNLDEAMVMGERVSVLIDGALVQGGTPREILERPAAESVARFLGYRNIFSGVAEAAGPGTRIDAGHFAITVEETITVGERVTACVRQQDIKVLREDLPVKDSLARNVYAGHVTSVFEQPETCTVWFVADGGTGDCDLELRLPRGVCRRHGLVPGKAVRVALWEPSIVVWRGRPES
jgi:ABC-type Fe3+/spermidine/putrescine transport system ATPase subunit